MISRHANGGEKGTKRTRVGRRSVPGQAYHITAVTSGRCPVFDCLQNGRLLVNGLQQLHEVGHASTIAYVVMPDHLHWLMQLSGKRRLSSVVAALKARTSRLIRRHWRDSVGSIWQSGFHDHAMRDEESLAATARYIIANPVRAGLVTSVGDYPLWDAQYL